MKLLSRILGRRLFKRFALWWYRITGQPATFTASGVYASMVALRIAEYDGPRASIVSGDSVAAAGELWFELIDGTRCTAIPGDRTDAFLTRIQHTVLIYKPQTVVLHLGGNDILADVDLDTIVGNLASIHKALRDGDQGSFQTFRGQHTAAANLLAQTYPDYFNVTIDKDGWAQIKATGAGKRQLPTSGKAGKGMAAGGTISKTTAMDLLNR